MATYNVSVTVGANVDEKLQRIFTKINEDLVADGEAPWPSIEAWFEDHLLRWGKGLWGEVVEHEGDEVKIAYGTLADKAEQNQIRALLRSLGATIEDIP